MEKTPLTYHVRIKKSYAAAIIKDLQKIDALEVLPDDDTQAIPEWQKKEVRKRVTKYKNSPEKLVDEAIVLKMLSKDK